MQMNLVRMHLQTNIQRREFLLLVIDDFHAAVLLNPKLTDDDVVDTAGGVCPGVGFVISAETKRQKGDKIFLKRNQIRLAKQFSSVHSLGQLQCDESLGLSFYALPPKLEFGVDGAMEDEILIEALSVKGTDWRVMAYLL